MTWLVPKLKNRVFLQTAAQTENSTSGGFDRSYSTVATIWAGLKPVKKSWYTRREQTEEADTHEFLIRRCALSAIGGAYSSGYSTGFDMGGDLTAIKSNYFIFVKKGSSVKGRRFRIRGIENADEGDEYYKARAEEIEEIGTGATA